MECVVAAPSRLLPTPGTRVKTDKTDAKHLAELLIGGLVTAVRIPDVDEEAARDLSRARADARIDLTRAKHRLSKLLLRHGMRWAKKTGWTSEYMSWLSKIRFEQPASQIAFDNDLATVMDGVARRNRLDTHISEMIPESRWEPIVTALGCLRGVSTITAFGLAVEIGDWTRFSASSIGAFVGLVPSEHSSGNTRRLGSITKTGNAHARTFLVEAAWHHRPTYRVGPTSTLRARWGKASPVLAARGDQANRRLHAQWVKYDQRGKSPCVANIAVARELIGFCWSLATWQEHAMTS
jgi:transposase